VDDTERRFTRRRPVSENRARILWDEGPGPLEAPARLVDISRGGAGFVSGSPIPIGREVCIRLDAPRKSGWVLARVVRFDGATEGGLSFARHFPHDLFASLI
jgi:PilZ domain